MRLGLGLALSGGGLPAFYPDATLALDFVSGAYRVGAGGYSTPNFASLPGLTVSRASVGYAERQDGTLVQFGNNVARITDKGLLVEESRTNLEQWSADFSNAVWTKAGSGTGSNVTVAASAVAAPDPSATAQLLTFARTDTTGSSTIRQTMTTSAANYVGAIWLMASTPGDVGKVIHIYQWNAGTAINVTPITLTGAWVRYTVGVGGAALGSGVSHEPLSLGLVASTGSTTGSVGVLAWGAQAEQAAFPTSYIPTTSASATRAADGVSVGGLSIASPLTMVGRIVGGTADGVNRYIADLNDGTTNNQFSIRRADSTNTNTARASSFISNVGVGVSAGATQYTGPIDVRIAAVQTAIDVRVSANGSSVSSAGQAGSFTMSKIELGASFSSGYANGYTQRVLIYPRAFSDAELQAASQ